MSTPTRRRPQAPTRRRPPAPPPWWRRPPTLVAASVAVIVAIVVIAVVSARGGGGTSSPTASPPTQAQALEHAVVRGEASAPVLVEEYGDFQCPACRAFQESTGPTIDQLVTAGSMRFAYYPFAFIGPESEAAASAALCANDQGQFWPYHDLLFLQQAPENSGALTADRLIAYGQQVGIAAPAFDTCVRDEKYLSEVRLVTQQGTLRGVTSTPTVLVNGVVLQDRTPQGLEAAVRAAAAATPSPTR